MGWCFVLLGQKRKQNEKCGLRISHELGKKYRTLFSYTIDHSMDEIDYRIDANADKFRLALQRRGGGVRTRKINMYLFEYFSRGCKKKKKRGRAKTTQNDQIWSLVAQLFL